MNKFLINITKYTFCLLGIGFLLVAPYYISDPFQVVKNYDDFLCTVVDLNEDYVATERYLKSPKSYKHFIFGSSRAGCGILSSDFSRVLEINEDSIFHFASSNESLYGIIRKIELIADLNGQIDNVIILIDPKGMLTKIDDSKGHLYRKHPMLSGEKTINFQKDFLMAYLNPSFFCAYWDYKFFGKKRSYMKGLIDVYRCVDGSKYIPFGIDRRKKSVENNPEIYYKNANKLFAKVPKEGYVPKQLFQEQLYLLNKLSQILKEKNTNYRVIISPLFDKSQINKSDLNKLRMIFGEEKVFDFSGLNSITKNTHYYFEPNHFRPLIGKKMLNDAFKSSVADA